MKKTNVSKTEKSNDKYSDLEMLELFEDEAMDCFEEDEDRDDVMDLTNNISFRISRKMLMVLEEIMDKDCDLLVHIPNLNDGCWVWFHNKTLPFAIISNSIENIQRIWHSDFQHTYLNPEYLKDGIIVALGQENLIVMKYEEYRGIALVDEALETCYAETLDLIFEVLQQHLSKECPDVNDGKYLEFMVDTYEIKDIDMSSIKVEALPVRLIHEELAMRPKGKDKWKLSFVSFKAFKKESIENVNYLIIKGKTMKECRKLEGISPEERANAVDRILCELLEDHPKLKSISMRDDLLYFYLKDILDILHIRRAEFDASISMLEIYQKAFEIENPITKEELDAYKKVSQMNEFEGMLYMGTLPNYLYEQIMARSEIDPNAMNKYHKLLDDIK